MPSATAREFQHAALGFVRRRQTGSHERWTHSDGRSVTIPLHGGREIGPPLFFKILRQLMCRWRNSIGCADSRTAPLAYTIGRPSPSIQPWNAMGRRYSPD
jgi:predicted RNA binding protein YcfA (HicA-like mRNA interferase family)